MLQYLNPELDERGGGSGLIQLIKGSQLGKETSDSSRERWSMGSGRSLPMHMHTHAHTHTHTHTHTYTQSSPPNRENRRT